MADPRLRPRGVKPSTTNDDVLTTVGGIAVWSPLPVTPTPIVSIDENNSPGLVFDDDGQIVYTED